MSTCEFNHTDRLRLIKPLKTLGRRFLSLFRDVRVVESAVETEAEILAWIYRERMALLCH